MTRKMKEKSKPKTAIPAWKGFDHNLQCRGFQFEVGKTYSVAGKIKACETGFHACPDHPFDVWEYYPPAINGKITRYGEVELSGETDRQSMKIAAASLHFKAEISLPQFIERGIKAILEKAGPAKNISNSGYSGAASNSGYSGAASNSGDSGAASNSGDSGAASNSGDNGAAFTNAIYSSAESNAKNGAAIAIGFEVSARASQGEFICIAERDGRGNNISIVSGIAGKDGVKPYTWYKCKAGKFVEATP